MSIKNVKDVKAPASWEDYKDDESKAMELNNFIMENREEVVKETITRKINI